MLRIEGNKGSRVVATLLAIAAVMVAWIVAPATANAARRGTVQWVVTGPQGGPFTPTQGKVSVTNSWNSKLRWYAIGDTSWLRIAGFNGVVKPGQTKDLSVRLQENTAASLTKGTYKAQIAFREPGTGQFYVGADLLLIVGDPPPPPPTSGQLDVTPPEGLTSQGTKGGTFSPLAKTYTLANRGGLPVNWKVTFDNDWVTTPGANSGTLQPNTSQDLQVRLDASLLANLPVGLHTSRVRFHDTDTGLEVTSREVSINVKSASSGAGWTQFTPSADTRMVYVSNSQGNDGNDGLSEASPKRTLGAGLSLLRDGYPDWLLLKKGDTWNGDLGVWDRSGRSPSEPMLISSYGSGARPRIQPSPSDHFLITWGGLSPRYLAFVDLHIVPQGGNSSEPCISWLTGGGHVLIEGCLIGGFDIGANLGGGSNFALRRNVVVDCTGHGMYVSDVSGLLLEENVFDHLGLPNPDVFKHGLYIDNEGVSGVVIRGNIVTDTSSHGLQLRPGGIVEDNLFARNAIALLLGGGDSWQSNPNGVVCEARRNVILDARNIDGGNLRGWGIEAKNIASAEITDNILANSPSAGYPRPVILGGPNSDGRAYNITFLRNTISGWKGPGIEVSGDAGSHIRNLVLSDNEVQNLVDASYLVEISDSSATGEIDSSNNTFYSSPMALNNWFLIGGANKSIDGYKTVLSDSSSIAKQMSYPNAVATVGGYHGTLGKTTTHEAFITEARKQSRDNWRPEYTAASVNAWIRTAFGQ